MAKLESIYYRIATTPNTAPSAAQNKFEVSGRVKLFSVLPAAYDGNFGGSSTLETAVKRMSTIFCNGVNLSDSPPTDFSLPEVRLVLPLAYARFANPAPNVNIPGGYILFEDGLTLYTGNGSSANDRAWLGNITLLVERG